jgi:ankyrin repeat protein
MEMLLGKGADVNQPTTSDDQTPLFAAAQQGHSKIV